MHATSHHVHQGHNLQFNTPLLHHPSPPIQLPNGHPQPSPQPALSAHQPNRPVPSAAPKEPINVLAIPSIAVQGNSLVVGDSQSTSMRSYTPLKVVGDGSFGTVWLCDWHGTLPPNTPLSPMQCGAGARPEWAGKRLVAVKRMKKKWDGGWDECRKLKELESLRAIPYHPNIIPLYDFFLLPDSKELYFVFESMEGNLYQLIKSRKGRPLAGGLVSSIFQQVISGLHHIHASGYFHRDMKPENLLVTTTGLHDYQSVSPAAPAGAPPEKDVKVIVKLADFGLARETKSKPPYTEYVSTRWYRAPEVLLRSKDYSNPVDMWALGTIMAELINLKPLFPGHAEIDQMAKICEVLGDPSDAYGVDSRGKAIGGGKWARGVKMAKAVGFQFVQIQPKSIYHLFDRSVPPSMIECISDLLKYDPDARLTSHECLHHTYITEIASRNVIPPLLHISTSIPSLQKVRPGVSASTSLPSLSPRSIPPSHSHSSAHSKPAFNNRSSHLQPCATESSTHRTPFASQAVAAGRRTDAAEYAEHVRQYQHSPLSDQTTGSHGHPPISSSVYSGGDGVSQTWVDADDMEVSSPHADNQDSDYASAANGLPMEIQMSPVVQEDPSMPREEEPSRMVTDGTSAGGQKSGKLGAFGFPKKPSKWGLGMFGHLDKQQNVLTPVDEVNVTSTSSTPSLKRTQSSSTDSRSLSELSPIREPSPPPKRVHDPKKTKKEADRMMREAEMARRKLKEKMAREQARAVIQKRHEMMRENNSTGTEFEWSDAQLAAGLLYGAPARTAGGKSKQALSAGGPIRGTGNSNSGTVNTVNAAAGRFASLSPSNDSLGANDHRWKDHERNTKARRIDYDDELSISSSDVHSIGRMSVMSFATVDSDPGPTRIRNRPSLFGLNRMTSTSSLRTSVGDEFSTSGRSSNSVSIDHQLANEFDTRASFDTNTSLSLSDGGSPPPMQMLSLSSPTQQWQQLQGGEDRLAGYPNYITLPHPVSMHPQHLRPPGPGSPYEFSGHPPSPGLASHSAINPMFKVPPLPSPTDRPSSSATLPPFSQLEAVAERGEYPPLSPMSFHSPDDP